MRHLLLLMLMTTASGCATVHGSDSVSGPGLCDGLQPAIRAHAAALAEDGGPFSLRTGRDLIEQIDAGCTP